jgi:NADH dehydrogenase
MPAANPMSTILVTGASGFVSRHTIPRLLEAGHRIVALARTDEAASAIRRRLSVDERDGVDTRIGDVTRRDTLAAALEGTDAVLHLAAIPRDYSGGAELRLVNTEGTRNLLVAAREAGVRRFVHQGALGVEDDPRLHYANSKAKAERLVTESGLDWTIVKPSLIWGPGDGFFNLIADLARVSPLVIPIPAGARSRFQPIGIHDVARCITAVFADPGTVGRTYELGGPRYWTYPEMVREVLRARNARRVLLPIPVPLIRLVAVTSELVRLPFPVASDQLNQLGLDNTTALDAVSRAFGFEPADLAGNLGYLRGDRPDQDPAGESAAFEAADA